MPARPAPALGLRVGDRERLSSWSRSSTVKAGLAQRARIVLLAADGVSNTEIARRVGVSRPTVIDWRGRYEGSGIAGLHDAPRSGRPRRIDHDQIISQTLLPPPKLGCEEMPATAKVEICLSTLPAPQSGHATACSAFRTSSSKCDSHSMQAYS